ncbi:uncharacterized protein LOC123670771 [Harmonia axyridis]|uniref:uncharacterized protein LOC123670771 n=1 Tax=Harmonia axyridis TaxID=115357 RepID=UPI001E278D1F|nr:uncharacterized protein LOC123670771 [Harmonia axyridis]
MDRTPKGKSLRFVRPNDKPISSKSPVKEAKKQRFWDHDADNLESNDVLWDWDSPKNIRPKALRVTKREIHKSPKLAPKKTSQTDHIKNYEKLKQELQALRDEIARTDDCLPLSPVDEQIFQEENVDSDINSFIEEQYFHIENQETEACSKIGGKQNTKETIYELLNDDCDEELFLCSQMIEEKLYELNQNTEKINEKNGVYRNDFNKNVDISNLNSSIQVQSELKNAELKNISENVINAEKHVPSRSIDDSFDAVLREFEDEDLDILSQTADKTLLFVPKQFQSKNTFSSNFKRTISDANVQYLPSKVENLNITKTGFPRTLSFESAATVKNNDNLPKHVMEQIEMKRKEALARLMERKDKEKRATQVSPSNNTSSDQFSSKCSSNEIERKRLQAKAIREAKQKEIIERNRQEAMRRLEMNRRKRMEILKSQEKKL